MKIAKALIAAILTTALVVPVAHAKKKNLTSSAQAGVTSPTSAAAQANSSSQAGGLPATNDRVTALEAAVGALQNALAAETAARKAADASLTAALNDEIAARQGADTALANQLAAIPKVFVADGSVNGVKGATVTVAARTVPAGTYFIQATIQMVNSQNSGDANARCVMRADGKLLADTSDLEFPVLVGATPNSALGSTMFAPLHGTYSSPAPIALLVECSESNGDNGALNAYAHIAALAVGTLQ
jgi:hypothetical protein